MVWGPPADTTKYMVHSPESSPVLGTDVHADEGRARNQAGKLENVLKQAANVSKKRNLEGKTETSHNSFAVLSDKEIMLRAAGMGVIIPDDKFESIDILRSLEDARNKLRAKNNISKHKDESYVVDNDLGDKIPLQIEWHEQERFDSDSFTLVESRKSKRQRRKSVVVARPCTRSVARAKIPPEPPGRNLRKRRIPERFK